MADYYRHFKGGKYKLLGIAKDSETLDILSSKWTFCHFHADKKSILPVLVPTLQYL